MRVWLKRIALGLCSVFVLCFVILFLLVRHFYTFPSPDGNAAVVLWVQVGLPDNGYDVTLEERWFHRSKKMSPHHNDCYLSIAHAAWSEDSRQVAFYKRGGLCPTVWFVFDRRRQKFLPFDTMAEQMRQSIRETYQLTDVDLRDYGGDPLRWAQGPGPNGGGPDPAAAAFREKRRFW